MTRSFRWELPQKVLSQASYSTQNSNYEKMYKNSIIQHLLHMYSLVIWQYDLLINSNEAEIRIHYENQKSNLQKPLML